MAKALFLFISIIYILIVVVVAVGALIVWKTLIFVGTIRKIGGQKG
ncbi:MAG: hypothetical protein IJB80_05830 [Clostridia bacterium]|nr:hypothetical protein [Clostridia bacterium]